MQKFEGNPLYACGRNNELLVLVAEMVTLLEVKIEKKLFCKINHYWVRFQGE